MPNKPPRLQQLCVLILIATTCSQELSAAGPTSTEPAAISSPNILFIAVDDLRPQLGCYGKTFMHTPNIDRLAGRGVLFERAYCMVPTCGASRASLMTSVRPSPKRFTSYKTWAEKDAPEAQPLHSHLKHSGYTTVSLGKVFHNKADHVDGWSVPPWRSSLNGYQDRESQAASIRENKRRWPEKKKYNATPFESAKAEDNQYPDGDCTREAISRLEKLAESPESPFFLAVGLLKPHLPFNAPKKYWDLYDAEQIDLPDNYFAPKDAPKLAVHNSGELRAYAGIHPEDPVDRDTAKQLIHGYYACVSFADAQIGKLDEALNRLGLRENTMIVLWGDHGWQLGEHGMWNKHSCFETSMHAPLLIIPPATADGIRPGGRVTSLVEFIDIYPTICDLAGIPTPEHVQGTSLKQVMQDPSGPGKPYAVGRFGPGDTIRSDQFRYSEYAGKKGELAGRMLYDHAADSAENENVAKDQESTSQQLSDALNGVKGR